MQEKNRFLLIGYIAVMAFFFGYFAVLLDQTNANKILELSKEKATLEFNLNKIELSEFKEKLEKADEDYKNNRLDSIAVDVTAIFFASLLPIFYVFPRKIKIESPKDNLEEA